jgi:hypothetical protein
MDTRVTIRLSEKGHERYAGLAKDAGVGLSTYLKRRLEDGDVLARQLADLRLAIADLRIGGADGKPSEADGKLDRIIALLEADAIGAPSDPARRSPDAVALETLLILRNVAQPMNVSAAQAEVKRNGVELWYPFDVKPPEHK